MVVALIAGGVHPPDDRFDARVEQAFQSTGKAFSHMRDVSAKERIARNVAKAKDKKQPVKAAANGTEGAAIGPN